MPRDVPALVVDDELRELLGQRTDGEIAELAGVGRDAVRRARREAGVAPARSRRRCRARVEAVLAALTRAPGATAEELAEAVGCTYRSAWRYLVELEQQRRARPLPGGLRPMRWTVVPEKV